MLALSSGSLYSLPFSLKGATPELSFLVDLMKFQNLFCLFGCWSCSWSPTSMRFSMYFQ
ncbi:hypothetical protein DPMN_074187 [Dreissena polymorpha]|uniref:Uncharacterized protein n=1 Tax=Dreissena polymorpha TaxID=45954 RepID=A0A9D3YFR1_DREPO|nr:hypothetical protein DPMN_074187 [Dreissena polymorpha]